jgi:hypothetical protein
VPKNMMNIARMLPAMAIFSLRCIEIFIGSFYLQVNGLTRIDWLPYSIQISAFLGYWSAPENTCTINPKWAISRP